MKALYILCFKCFKLIYIFQLKLSSHIKMANISIHQQTWSQQGTPGSFGGNTIKTWGGYTELLHIIMISCDN